MSPAAICRRMSMCSRRPTASTTAHPIQLPFTDEGRALLQIVHDVAPGAALAFYTGDQSEADFATGIGKLASSA